METKMTTSNTSVTPEIVLEIIAALGGAENILVATHCITRLRLVLKDESRVDSARLNQIFVKGCFSANGQYQVVIGQGVVDQICELLLKIVSDRKP